MGCTASNLKGDAVSDLASSPSKSQPLHSSSLQPKSISSDQPEKHDGTTSTKAFDSTYYTHTIPPPQQDLTPQQPPTSKQPEPADTKEDTNKPRKQSLAQRWKERKGVPEPKDEHGRGVYSGKTTEELVKQARAQVVDGRVCAAE
jgi:hypothetical protein